MVFDEQPIPDSFTSWSGRRLRPHNASMIEAVTESWPQPAHSVDIALVSVGSSRGAVTEARDILARRGIPIDYMRIKAFPFTKEVEAFMASHQKIFVVEQNRDAQLKSLLTLETDVPKSKLHSILHYSGLPMTSKEIVEAVLAELGDARRATLAATP